MIITKQVFFECDNPDCRLRFPGNEGYARSRRCPVCRSSIHAAAPVENISEKDKYSDNNSSLKVEALLDNIRSAWNVGSIFRTADGTGIRKLYLTGITASPENPKVRKTALGAETSIAWEKHNNGVQLAGRLKSRGYILWALEDLPGAIPLFQMEAGTENYPIVLILGNEVAGVDPGIIDLCSQVVSIPMLGKKQSYNVTVAFGIAASFILYRQIVSQESLKIFPNT